MLVVLALAGITIVRPLERQATLLVLDASASMSSVRDQVEATARSSAGALRTQRAPMRREQTGHWPQPLRAWSRRAASSCVSGGASWGRPG